MVRILCCAHLNCSSYRFVDNIFEELDWPTEFYYDVQNQKLYYNNNATGAPPSDSTSFVATNLKVTREIFARV